MEKSSIFETADRFEKFQIETLVGGRLVISTGVAMVPKGESFVLWIKTRDEPLAINIAFEDNKESDDQTVSFVGEGKFGAKLLLTNFNNSLGTALSKPLNIGNLEGNNLTMQLYVEALENMRTVSYSLMVEP